MARLPAASRDRVPEDQRSAFDELIEGYGSVPRFGPASILVRVPKVHQIMNALNQYLRNQSSLPKEIQELAMLVTARALDCQYVWNAHAASARASGVPDALVVALRERTPLPPLPDDQLAVVRYGQEFFHAHRVSRGTFQLALEQLGERGVVELGLVFGNYGAIALLVNSHDVELPPERTEPILAV